MSEPRPTFTARRKTQPAIGWIVEATWSNGQVDTIEGFSSEAKAVKWIAEQSENWLGNSAAG
jgi:predicted acyl esterase